MEKKSTKKYYYQRVESGLCSKTFWVKADILQKIRNQAKKNGRSVTSEIQTAVEHYYSLIM